MADEEVEDDGAGGGFEVRPHDLVTDFVDGEEMETLHLTVLIPRSESVRELQIKNKLRIRKQSTLR